MRTLLAAHLAAEAEAEAASRAATASAHAVLFSLDLWAVLWPSLDHDSKVAMRGVSSAMRRQVDASIEVVASPASDFFPDALTAAVACRAPPDPAGREQRLRSGTACHGVAGWADEPHRAPGGRRAWHAWRSHGAHAAHACSSCVEAGTPECVS
jgi:hypothetical protein